MGRALLVEIASLNSESELRGGGRVTEFLGCPVLYDESGRVVEMGSRTVRYDESGRVVEIGGHTVRYEK